MRFDRLQKLSGKRSVEAGCPGPQFTGDTQRRAEMPAFLVVEVEQGEDAYRGSGGEDYAGFGELGIPVLEAPVEDSENPILLKEAF